MELLIGEVKQWNTPALGACLLWHFSKGYCSNHPHGDAPVALLHFIAVAILTSAKLNKPINNHRENLQSYAQCFEGSKETDLLLHIQDRVKNKRKYTLEAIDIGISKGLLAWDATDGKIYPREVTTEGTPIKSLKFSCAKESKKAEILGKWFAKHELSMAIPQLLSQSKWEFSL